MTEQLQTISYQEFKAFHFQTAGDSGYRLGQHFINSFIEVEDNQADFSWLWNANAIPRIDNYIAGFIISNQWDYNALQLVRPLVKAGDFK